MVYKSEICSRSEFFRSACSDRWSESGQDPIELPTDSPEIFDLYLHCLYKDMVDVGSLLEPIAGEEDVNANDRIDYRLVSTYILADKLRDVVTANLVMDDIIDLYEQNCVPPLPPITTIVARNTPVKSPLRRFFVGLIAGQSFHRHRMRVIECEDTPKDFICEIVELQSIMIARNPVKSLQEVFNFPRARRLKKSRYHQHDALHLTCSEECDREKVQRRAKFEDRDGKFVEIKDEQ